MWWNERSPNPNWENFVIHLPISRDDAFEILQKMMKNRKLEMTDVDKSRKLLRETVAAIKRVKTESSQVFYFSDKEGNRVVVTFYLRKMGKLGIQCRLTSDYAVLRSVEANWRRINL